MIKTIIIDDEKIALEEMRYFLEHYPELQVQALFTDPVEALENLQLLQPELVFLDIEMPGVNGIFLAEQIAQTLPDTVIVFVTAYDEYAIKAFDFNAVDYVLKPVSLKRIDRTVHKLLKHFSMLRVNNETKSKHVSIKKPSEKTNKIFALEDDGKIVLLSPAEVILFTPMGRDAIVHTQNKKYKTKQSLNYWEERLAENNFFRCHKSYLVNFDKIKKLIPMFNNTYILEIDDDFDEIPVSRNKAKELCKILDL